MKARSVSLRLVECPAETSDKDLVASCAAGDVAALGELFDRYQQVVYEFLIRFMGGYKRDVDDLVQATFLELQRCAAKFRGGSTIKTWILGIAFNVARHHVRGEGRRKATLSAFADLPHVVDRHDPEEAAARREFFARLSEALVALPPDLRATFILSDIEGIPYAEAASALGVRLGTFSRRLHDARKALRKILGGEL